MYPAVYIYNKLATKGLGSHKPCCLTRRLLAVSHFTSHAIYNCKHVHYWILEIFELNPDFCGISLVFLKKTLHDSQLSTSCLKIHLKLNDPTLKKKVEIKSTIHVA